MFQVADLIGKYPDLMEGFNEFMEHCEKNGNNLRKGCSGNSVCFFSPFIFLSGLILQMAFLLV